MIKIYLFEFQCIKKNDMLKFVKNLHCIINIAYICLIKNKQILKIKKLNKMTTITIFAATLFIIALVGFIFGLIALILPTVKKALINLCALMLILTVIFVNLVRDIARATKYVTIG